MDNKSYRVVLHKDCTGDYYGLHECFRVGKRDVISEAPLIVADTKSQLIDHIDRMWHDAIAMPVVGPVIGPTAEDFVKAFSSYMERGIDRGGSRV